MGLSGDLADFRAPVLLKGDKELLAALIVSRAPFSLRVAAMCCPGQDRGQIRSATQMTI